MIIKKVFLLCVRPMNCNSTPFKPEMRILCDILVFRLKSNQDRYEWVKTGNALTLERSLILKRFRILLRSKSHRYNPVRDLQNPGLTKVFR